MFDEPFRARFAAVARPAATWLARAGVTPNQITIAACILGLTAAGMIATGHPRLGLALWLASRIADGLDGAVARAAGTASAFGGFLDITLDMMAYVAVVLAFAVAYPALSYAWMCILAGYVLVITTTLALSDAASAAARRVSVTDRTFQFTPGLTEAGETSVMYTLWVLFPEHLHWLTWVWAGALLATSAQRIYLGWRLLR
ncbi:MAG: CDP-alcohol phosphatidyltransferase family protein [Acidobacteria bacterium]|nr:CDP-alcohol phosphatidyltransferase family protein [Acidobacteriota bacterium]